MQHTELLLHLAEIAGVFVGFGALISIRSEAIRDEEVMMIRQIVIFGIMVVITALLPVVVSGFGVTAHGLWAPSAGVFLILFWASSVLNQWDFERTRALARVNRRTRVRMEIPAVPFWLSMHITLILILTGRFPRQESALYLVAVVLNLLITAQLLLYLVYMQRSRDPGSLEDAEAEIDAHSPAQNQETPPIATH